MISVEEVKESLVIINEKEFFIRRGSRLDQFIESLQEEHKCSYDEAFTILVKRGLTNF